MKNKKKAFSLIELLLTLSIIAILSLMVPNLFINYYKLTYYPLENTKSILEFNNLINKVQNVSKDYQTYKEFETVYLKDVQTYYKIELQSPVSGGQDTNLIFYGTGETLPEKVPSLGNPNLLYVIELIKNDLDNNGIFDSVKTKIYLKDKSLNTEKNFENIILF